MRALERKPKATQRTASSEPAIAGRTSFRPCGAADSLLYLQRAIGNETVLRSLRSTAEGRSSLVTGAAAPGFGHDFSRIPEGPPEAGRIRAKQAGMELEDQYPAGIEKDIFFRKNAYGPDSMDGGQPPALQFTHVVRQKVTGEKHIQRSLDETLESLAGGAASLGDLASARWLWEPITGQLAQWEGELDRIGEEGSPTALGSVLMVPVAMLFVVLQAIVGVLDLLARLNPASLALRGVATEIRAETGQYTREDFTRDALAVGEQALDIITLGLRNAFLHLAEGIREGNAFRITQAISEFVLAAMAIFGIFRAIRARCGGGLRSAAAAEESVRPRDVLDRPGTVTRNPPGSERFSVRESHGANRFGDPEARYYAEAWLDEQGILEGDFMLRRPAEELGVTPPESSTGYVRSSQLRGAELYREALEYLRRRHGAVRGLRGRWGHGDNLAAFNRAYARLRAQGMADAAARQSAALDTFTGRIAASEPVGYTRVHIESATFDAASNTFTEVIVVFYPP